MSAATGALGPVLGKLVALLGDEYKRLRGIHIEIKSLTQELQAIDAFLESMAEAEDPNRQDKAWMKEVRELSYDIEDNLDEFMARVIADKSAKPADGIVDKIKGSLKRVKARHEIAKAIEDLKKQAIEVSQRNLRYQKGGASNAGSAPRVDPRAIHIFNNASKLVGVDGPKRRIIKLLDDCKSGSQQTTKLVAVVGSGGLGKTTIANQVYQDLKGQFKYQYCAFLSVSRNPDITRVMSNIYSQLNENYSSGTEDLQTIIRKIKDFLEIENKRYLVVVDDIWKEGDWDVIKCAFPKTSSGSKIITTTRINSVAKSCCSEFSGEIYNLWPLNMKQSRQLLHTRLFGSEEKCPSELEEISCEILKKCAGLPLAIIAISGVLADKASKKDEWEQVKHSVGRALRNPSIETMVNIISLSYLDLPPDLRTCMLYFSIFPEDHIIEKDNLIRRWIGEGFIHKQAGVRTLHESAELCFNELINRSLIQPSEIDWEEFGGSSEVKSCRVHDTVLDFIVSKAVEENFVTVIDAPGFVNPDPLNKVRRLSLQNMGEIPPDLDVSHSRSLHVFGRNAKIPSLSEFRLLRVLDFDECGQLKDDGLAGIGNLLHLKYLRFRHAHSRHSVTKLPEELARLQHLEIDIMQDCEKGEVMMIPEIVQKQLVCYVTVIAEEYTALKDEIAGIQGLRVLENVDVYAQSIEFLEGLGSLKNLRELGIHFQKKYIVGDNWVEKQEKAVLSVWKLGHASLESLYIHVDKADPDPIMEEDWFPCPPCGIRKLSIQGESLTAVPKWMKSLVKLENLSLVLSGDRKSVV